MGDDNLIALLLGSTVLAGILGAFVKGFWEWITGRHDRERAASKDRRDTITVLKAEVKDAETEADQARAEAVRQHDLALGHQQRAGQLWEYANQLRQRLICKHGENGPDLPPWPEI